MIRLFDADQTTFFQTTASISYLYGKYLPTRCKFYEKIFVLKCSEKKLIITYLARSREKRTRE